jgi:hypothetical protein
MKRRFKNLLLAVVVFQTVGCSQFTSRRDFLSEMESDDTQFFNPQQDFPVVAGDNGEFGISDEERRSRTPASAYDIENQKNTLSLEQELESLERKQNEDDLNYYNKYRHKLATTSERIYFLKIPYGERREYLESRGMIENNPAYSSSETALAIRKSDILLGMSKDDVTTSWGEPMRVEVAGNPRNENERWLYKADGASRYIYFESGRVEGWE